MPCGIAKIYLNPATTGRNTYAIRFNYDIGYGSWMPGGNMGEAPEGEIYPSWLFKATIDPMPPHLGVSKDYIEGICMAYRSILSQPWRLSLLRAQGDVYLRGSWQL